MLNEELRTQIDGMVGEHKVVLFMKGSRSFPQCGFSATCVGILDEYLPAYETVNVLADQSIREGIKEYSDWPTIPQLYVDGEFVGGCDIIKDLESNDELSSILGTEKAEAKAPEMSVTESAVKALAEASEDEDHKTLRFEISPRFEYGLSFGPKHDGDFEVVSNGLTILFDVASSRRADGLKLDYVDGPGGTGFRIDNPNEPPKVKNVNVTELKSLLDDAEKSGETLHIYDVRSDEERAQANIRAVPQLTPEAQEKILGLPKDTPLYFTCRSGNRSMQAAQHFLTNAGFTNVSNIEGGILAWAAEIDTSLSPT